MKTVTKKPERPASYVLVVGYYVDDEKHAAGIESFSVQESALLHGESFLSRQTPGELRANITECAFYEIHEWQSGVFSLLSSASRNRWPL